MNLGRSPGRSARWLLAVVGRPVLPLISIATAAIAFATRPPVEPVGEWRWSPIDLPFYLSVDQLRTGRIFREELFTSADYAYVAGLMLWCIAGTLLVLRGLLGVVCRLRYRQHAAMLRPTGRTALVAMVFGLVSGVCVGVGWPYRLGTHYAARYAREKATLPTPDARWSLIFTLSSHALFGARADGKTTLMSPDDPRAPAIVRAAARYGARPEDRVAALSLAMRWLPRAANRQLAADLLAADASPEVLRASLYALAVLRDPADAGRVEPFLDHPDATVRAAAIDARGFMHFVPDANQRDHWEYVASKPSIDAIRWWSPAGDIANAIIYADYPADVPTTFQRQPLSPEVAEKFRARLVDSASTRHEREAAARAVQSLQQSQNDLRMAEFTLWRYPALASQRAVATDVVVRPPHVAVACGEVAAAKQRTPSVLLGHPSAIELASMLFLTSPQPTAVDISLAVHQGYADAVYPPPSDEVWMQETTHRSEPTRIQSTLMNDVHGSDSPFVQPWKAYPRDHWYPWLGPTPGQLYRETSHPAYFVGTHLNGVGYRWHSLLVTPDVPAWMQPPTLPDDADRMWWERLRGGATGGVWSRGAAERFVYIEGRALAGVPLNVSTDRDKLTVVALSNPRETGDEIDVDVGEVSGPIGIDQTARKGRRDVRLGLYVSVRDGKLTAQKVRVPSAGAEETVAHQLRDSGNAIADPRSYLHDWLTDSGMTGREADAVLSAWDAPLLRAEGQRLLVLLAAVDSDSRLVLEARPKPQTLVRTGIAWWEF